MSVNGGDRLGPYEILEKLGAGGMGEVWLAQDTRLKRKVAVKILPVEFAGMPDRLARFEQEARAAAALNHPHIAVVHDVGHEDGVHFMVQEHLEGSSLRKVIQGGRPPLNQALKLAGEICEALAAAHAAGIVHRDLKPENLFVTEDGHAKVLDFGLAKLTEMAMTSSPGSASMSPTMLGTVVGQIMGTAGYMAPEQVHGEEVDHRADLFAFGCVLYELTAGSQAFCGKNMIETLNRVTNVEPDGLVTIDGSLPAELQRILDKALAKDRRQRYQTAGDLAVDLAALGRSVESGKAIPIAIERAESSRRGGLASAAVAGIALGALALGVLGATFMRVAPAAGPLVHLTFDSVVPGEFNNIGRRAIDISPDGRRVAFTAEDAIWLRDLDSPELVRVRGTDDSSSPLLSPDGEWIAFYADDQLRKVPVAGGAPLRLADIANPYGTSWESDGTILVAQGRDGILRIPEDGGEPELVVAASAEGSDFVVQGPSLLPGGEWLLFAERDGGGSWSDARVMGQSMRTGERRLLVTGGSEPRFVASGQLVFFRDSTLFAVPFDPDAVEVTGGAVPLVEGVRRTRGTVTGGVFYDVSVQGDLVYVDGGGGDDGADYHLAFYDLDGGLEVLPFEPDNFDNPSVSPDGDRVAVDVVGSGAERDIWIYDLARSTRQRLTDGAAAYRSPIWSPDANWVYYAGESSVYRRRSDFTGEAEQVGDGDLAPDSVSPDGTRLAVRIQGRLDIGILNLESGEVEAVVQTPAIEVSPHFSPDGRFLVYVSNEGDGTFKSYVRELDTGVRHVVSPAAAGSPVWSPDGQLLYYIGANRMLTEVPVQIGERLTLGTPRPLFEASAIPGFPHSEIDPHPDGRRFLIVTTSDSDAGTAAATPSQMHVVLNWTRELQLRVSPR